MRMCTCIDIYSYHNHSPLLRVTTHVHIQTHLSLTVEILQQNAQCCNEHDDKAGQCDGVRSDPGGELEDEPSPETLQKQLLKDRHTLRAILVLLELLSLIRSQHGHSLFFDAGSLSFSLAVFLFLSLSFFLFPFLFLSFSFCLSLGAFDLVVKLLGKPASYSVSCKVTPASFVCS